MNLRILRVVSFLCLLLVSFSMASLEPCGNMSKKEKAKIIQGILESLYPSPQIPLKHTTPYTLLIAVILSAQCTDARVNTITPQLFSKADNPADMIKLSIDDIENIIRPCGLAPSKAKAIWKLSEILVKNYEGQVPRTFQELEALPGVGHKTASVVMTQAFGKYSFPVDTHIHRCAKRWGLTKGNSVTQTERDLKKIFPKELWGKIHLQIIYAGREYCKARRHDQTKCPICRSLFRNTP